MENSGIILEGGAMRSMFSAGVLDSFLDNKIEIPNVMAVSAGAYAGMNYVSGQKGRALDAVNICNRSKDFLLLFFKKLLMCC